MLYLYRCLETNDDLDPIDHGVVTAESDDLVEAILTEHLEGLRLFEDAEAGDYIPVRVYPLDATGANRVLPSARDFIDVKIWPPKVQ